MDASPPPSDAPACGQDRRCAATSAPEQRVDPTELPGLVLQMLPRSEPIHFGVDVAQDPLALHVAPLVVDRRGAAGALFGFRAPAEWDYTGAVLIGRTRLLDDTGASTAGGEEVSVAVIVGRDGSVEDTFDIKALSVQSARPPSDRQACHPLVRSRTGPHGLIVDALLRSLGLPAAGATPPTSHLALAIWTEAIAAEVHRGGSLSWRQIVELLPMSPMRPAARFIPTASALAASIVEHSATVSWVRIHSRAATGESLPHDLAATEAAWMDPTMYARWLLSATPNPLAVTELVGRCDTCTEGRLREVIDLVVAAAEVDDDMN